MTEALYKNAIKTTSCVTFCMPNVSSLRKIPRTTAIDQAFRQRTEKKGSIFGHKHQRKLFGRINSMFLQTEQVKQYVKMC